MKLCHAAVVAAAALAVTAKAQMVSVVQITDMRGDVGYQVLDRDQYNAVLQNIKEETAAYAAVMAESKKEWDANKDNKLPFQGKRVKPRTAKKMPPDFNDREKAEKRRAQLEERYKAKQSDEKEKASNKLKMSKLKESDRAKEDERSKAYDDCYNLIVKKMGEKLGRPVPSFGF
jgi:type IV secretory pathway VirB10-like protein